jgi:hypothetical protein
VPLDAALRELQALVAKNNIGARRRFAALRPELDRLPSRELAATISACLERLDFRGAEAAIAQLSVEIGAA